MHVVKAFYIYKDQEFHNLDINIEISYRNIKKIRFVSDNSKTKTKIVFIIIFLRILEF